MRMWKVPPYAMCRQHLLGEHLEMHMFAGVLRKGLSLRGYIDRGLVEVDSIGYRHDQLVLEMFNRGYEHKTPLDVSWIPLTPVGDISVLGSTRILRDRCPECRALQIRKEVYSG